MPEPLAPGTSLGSYVIERMLGRGGMGAVYLAFDRQLQRKVALKVLDDERRRESSAQLLLREARSAAALNHPSICHVYEVGEAAAHAFIAMEYVEGRPLSAELDAGPLRDEVFTYGTQAAEALAFAHQHGVIHRDFKAANVMITASGRIKIIDFGLARREGATHGAATTIATIVPAGSIAGTPYAMSPEQVRGEAADARSDVWALGILLYETASGAKPFRGATSADVFSAILRDPVPPLPSLPPALWAIIERCLAKDPASRYQHAGEVHAALDAARHATTSAPPQTMQFAARRWVWTAAVVVAVAMLAFAANISRQMFEGVSRRSTVRLAVLPLENLTGDPSQDFLSDGLTEEIIAQLGRLHPDRLSVIARTSSMQYKNRAVPVSQIGRELGVDYVLEGSTRREANRVRITATLIAVSDQAQKWTDTFERDLSGIITLQNDVAKGVAQSMQLALLPEVRARLDRAREVKPEAYEAYLRGRSHAVRQTRDDFDAALQYYELALDKDPSYALAWAGIAQVWSGRQQMGFASPAVAAPQMKTAAAKAVALDDSSSEAHLRLAVQAVWTDWNWIDGEREFTRAIALGPNNSDAHAFYSHFLYIMHRPREALAEMQRALELDPLSELVQSLNGTTLLWQHRYAEAMESARHLLKTTPGSNQALNQLAGAYYGLGDFDNALAAEKQWWRARNDKEIESALDAGFAEGGYKRAMRRAADLLASRDTRNAGANRVAAAYAKAGAFDEAFMWIDKMADLRDPNMPYLSTGQNWDPLRGDPRFKAVLRRMNLPD